jgi:hypothetical protein
MDAMRYNKDFIAEMLAENSRLTTGSRAQDATPGDPAAGYGSPPRPHLDVDDAALQRDGYGMGAVIGPEL